MKWPKWLFVSSCSLLILNLIILTVIIYTISSLGKENGAAWPVLLFWIIVMSALPSFSGLPAIVGLGVSRSLSPAKKCIVLGLINTAVSIRILYVWSLHEPPPTLSAAFSLDYYPISFFSLYAIVHFAYTLRAIMWYRNSNISPR